MQNGLIRQAGRGKRRSTDCRPTGALSSALSCTGTRLGVLHRTSPDARGWTQIPAGKDLGCSLRAALWTEVPAPPPPPHQPACDEELTNGHEGTKCELLPLTSIHSFNKESCARRWGLAVNKSGEILGLTELKF